MRNSAHFSVLRYKDDNILSACRLVLFVARSERTDSVSQPGKILHRRWGDRIGIAKEICACSRVKSNHMPWGDGIK